MLRTRVIPVLLLRGESLVKTKQFRKFEYIGDPCNTVRIFNELEVDELAFLDITATRKGRGPNFELLADIASECFMPLSYGGGLRTFDEASRVFSIGFEKVIVNSHAVIDPAFMTRIATVYGSQAVIASIDIGKSLFGGERVVTHGGRTTHKIDPVRWAKEMETRGAGEILLTSIPREGSWKGFDLELIKRVSSAVDIPVIAHGGAGEISDISRAVYEGGASSVAVGSMVVFQKKDYGVLVNFPEPAIIEDAFKKKDPMLYQ